jgi:hypothetical protein
MPITSEWLNSAEQALREACPLTINDEASVAALKAKVITYDKQLGIAPNIDWVIKMAVPFENALLAKKEAAEAEVRAKRDKVAARKKERDYDRLPASAIRAEAIEDLRKRNVPTATEQFVPEREYTQSEIDKFSDAEAKLKLFGIEADNLNESKPDSELRKIQERRILHTPRSKDTPILRSLRHEIRKGLL